MPLTTFAVPFRPLALSIAAISGRHILAVFLPGFGLTAIGVAFPSAPMSLSSLTAGVALMVLAGFVWGGVHLARWLRDRDYLVLTRLFGESDMVCLLTDAQESRILWCNDRATALVGVSAGRPASDILADLSADPVALSTRLQDIALARGHASHQVQIQGHLLDYRVEMVAGNVCLWRIDSQPHSDLRDILPFELIQFDGAGKLSYLSPSLREILPCKNLYLGTIFADALPPPGQVVPLSLGAQRLRRHAIRLSAQGSSAESVLLLPDAHLTMPMHDTDAALASHAALQKMPVGIAHVRPDGQLTYLNDEARRLLRLRDGQLPLLSDTLEGLGRPVMEWLADVIKGRLTRSNEVLRLNNVDGETYLKVTLTAPVADESADVVAVLSDVTEFKSLEAKFTQSQKMQAIGQLAGGVAHDFNNLLTAISGHCDLLLLRHDRSDLDYPDLMQIQQNTNRAAALVRQLLALSRQQTLKFVTLELPETMGDVIHLLNRLVGEKITLTLRHGENVAPVRSDKRQFEQVLMNLVVNARDALPLGGEIRIETEACALPDGLQRDHVHLPAGEYTRIRITDDGIGIPQTLLPKVFDPFFTTKRPGEGTGLGLSTVYGIVKQSGGYIFVDSEEGVGTTFTLYFAAQPPEASDEAAPGRSRLQAAPLQSRRALVLLVEDEAPVRSFAARALELQGHRVIEADCGEAALEILSDPEIRPDFFVTDVIMPGLDGPGWIARIRDRFPDTPVLFVSGYAEDSRVAAQARISNATFLDKPFSLAEFTATVNEQLRQGTEAA